MTVKRLIDVIVAAVGLLVTAPIVSLIAVLVRLRMGSPVLFRQTRPGHQGAPFDVLKFRTMRDTRGPDGSLLSDAERLTPLGRLLRRSSLDELPQLWNVLRGDMSLVGPRPLLMEYLERYTPEQMRRHAVKPGITGLSQVSGRQEIPFSKRLELDVWYVDNWSLALDMRILLRTVRLALRRSGVLPGQDVRDVDDLGLSVGLYEGEGKQ
jgi:lipopolysaccharide/colanic/teichoic acid biosynthesis glycosyltransferase